MTAQAYPLDWPEGWPRARTYGEARYSVGYSIALSEMLHELGLLKATGIVVSSNLRLRRDGLPYAAEAGRKIDDPGVAVYFMRQGKQQVIACDKWNRPQHNIRAIGLTVVGLRAIARAGATELLDRAFTGFRALPEHVEDAWWTVLGCSPDANIDEAKATHRQQINKHHTDRGGDLDKLIAVNRAWAQAQEHFQR